MEIRVIHHASIRLEDGVVIYFDPYDIHEERHDADYVFITHDHYDHYDLPSISKVSKEDTKIILPECLKDEKSFLVVSPDTEYSLNEFSFRTIPSYNLHKNFHPKEKNYVGYQIFLNGVSYYIMGDTDRTPEADMVSADVSFVPIGGVYTMDVREASDYINFIKPKKVIPIHYGKIVGDVSLGYEFQKNIDSGIEVDLMIKENEK